MGMSIEEFEEYAKSHNILIMTKDFYENRLRADMVAMLTELQLEFEEDLECGAYCDNCQKSCEDIPARWFLDFIQQKINSLKEARP